MNEDQMDDLIRVQEERLEVEKQKMKYKILKCEKQIEESEKQKVLELILIGTLAISTACLIINKKKPMKKTNLSDKVDLCSLLLAYKIISNREKMKNSRIKKESLIDCVNCDEVEFFARKK